MNKYEELLNAIRTNYGTHSEYYKTVKELVDQTKTPTLEEVKKEWEEKGFAWIETEFDIKLICREPTTYLKIRIFKNTKTYQGIINIQEHNLVSKIFRALGWEV